MRVIYINLDGTTFEGPLFNPAMVIVSFGGRFYRSRVVREELGVNAEGKLIYPEDGND